MTNVGLELISKRRSKQHCWWHRYFIESTGVWYTVCTCVRYRSLPGCYNVLFGLPITRFRSACHLPLETLCITHHLAPSLRAGDLVFFAPASTMLYAHPAGRPSYRCPIILSRSSKAIQGAWYSPNPSFIQWLGDACLDPSQLKNVHFLDYV